MPGEEHHVCGGGESLGRCRGHRRQSRSGRQRSGSASLRLQHDREGTGRMFGMPLTQTQRQRRLTEGGGAREPPSFRDIKWKYSHSFRFLGKEIHKKYCECIFETGIESKVSSLFSRQNETQIFKAADGNSVLKSFFIVLSNYKMIRGKIRKRSIVSGSDRAVKTSTDQF